jgi:hypothetical protein
VERSIKIKVKTTQSPSAFLMILIMMISFPELYSQDKHSKPTRQSALEAFSKDNFEMALAQFSELSITYPKDPLYKYYSGVCLVRLNKDPDKAASLLQEAMQGSAAMKMVPGDCLFYLARAQQMEGKFGDAIKSYNLYTKQAGKKVTRDAGAPRYIQQCNEGKGQIAQKDTGKNEMNKTDSIKVTPEAIVQTSERNNHQASDTGIKKNEMVPPGYENQLSEALDYQFRADSLTGIALALRKELDTIRNDRKEELRSKISNIEQLASYVQIQSDKRLAEAQTMITKPESEKPGVSEKVVIKDSTTVRTDSVKLLLILTKPVFIKDTLQNVNVGAPQKNIGQQVVNKVVRDSINQKVAEEKPISSVTKTPETYSIFEVKVKPASIPDEKVVVNPSVPSGLIYYIQVAVFKNLVAISYFKGISPVYGFKAEEAGVTNYYAGMFRRSADAAKALVRVKGLGFKDAFVVAIFDKKIVSADRANILEKEWGNKSLILVSQKTHDIQRDTVPQTLVFRVEVAKTTKPLKAEQLENIKKLAGSRGLDILTDDQSQNIYLIGKFLTFDSASEYAGLLTRNGQKDAKVVAYLGKKEIPVEAAKQLFEKY